MDLITKSIPHHTTQLIKITHAVISMDNKPIFIGCIDSCNEALNNQQGEIISL